MRNSYFSILSLATILLCSCSEKNPDNIPHADASNENKNSVNSAVDKNWNSETIYFLLTDRFSNGDTSNDLSYGRESKASPLRGFFGGDLAGVTQKIEAGYFNKLGVDAIWTTPIFEQVQAPYSDPWGTTYAYHGYWIRDWTTSDLNFGDMRTFENFVETAHRHGIRVIMDVIINHTGPETSRDKRWPDEWVRSEPECDWTSFAGNVQCNLAASIPDIKTENTEAVELPKHLLAKWKSEGRLKNELSKLDNYFERTNKPRTAPRYIISWLGEWVRKFGIDGFRIDTAKHVEPEIWLELEAEAKLAFNDWKTNNPEKVLDNREFFIMGEVMHFGVDGWRDTPAGTRLYDFGDRQVDYFEYGFDSLINMAFANHANWDYEKLFSTYSKKLNNEELRGVGIVNYIASHDDAEPFDAERKRCYEAAIKLLLAPGAAQIYYGDEIARPLIIEGTSGDSSLRSLFDWAALDDSETQALLLHWQKLGQFRQQHPAIGAGVHQLLNLTPYTFSRTLNNGDTHDSVLIALSLDTPLSEIYVFDFFGEGTKVRNVYTGEILEVKSGSVKALLPSAVFLLEEILP